MKQRTLAMMNGFERYSKKTRRALFLEQMEQVVPWQKLCGLIEPFYPQTGNGRRPVGVERMLRMYFLQQWFNLSDPAVEDTLYESPGMREFVGIDLGQEPVPDETTVCKFRHLLEAHNLGGAMLEAVNVHLESRGTAVHSTTIARVERAIIVRIIHEDPVFARLFIGHLLSRVARIEEDFLDQLFNSSEKRLARTLLTLANFGTKSKLDPAILKVSQGTLAEMVGTTRSRVSFFMNRFRKLGLIDYNGSLRVHRALLTYLLHE